jgi:hydroxymethylpyrimidine pyrophosphatase-like HAD family hydrolase
MRESGCPLLYCFDFDGTLVDEHPHPSVHPELNAFLQSVHNRGGVWTVNSGRTLDHILEGLTEHGIRPLPDFIMARERELYAPSRGLHRWVEMGSWNRRAETEHRRFLDTHRAFFRRVQQFLEQETRAEWVVGLEETPCIVASSEREMNRISVYLDEVMRHDDVLAYERNGIYLRFSHVKYNKGTVLLELARQLRISSTETCSAGDNHNDVAMLRPEVARYRVCPANAITEVQSLVRDTPGGWVGKQRASFGILEGIAKLLA